MRHAAHMDERARKGRCQLCIRPAWRPRPCGPACTPGPRGLVGHVQRHAGGGVVSGQVAFTGFFRMRLLIVKKIFPSRPRTSPNGLGLSGELPKLLTLAAAT